MDHLSTTLGKTFASGWPHWRGISKGKFDLGSRRVQFTIRLAERLKAEAENIKLPQDPATIIHTVHDEAQKNGPLAFPEAWSDLEDSLIALVYGSNYIESAGAGLDITIKICQDIFRGIPVTAEIQESDPDYQKQLEDLVKIHGKSDIGGVIRSRREIINHAKALNYLIEQIVHESEPWTEELILKTHQILYDAVDENIEAGKYRDYEVGVVYNKPGEKKKRSECIRAQAVPGYMKSMVEHLNSDIEKAEKSGILDPYTMAARFHHQFVMIHPFGDGNGRMSRIIFNTLLLKYAGHLSTFGDHGSEKEEYLAIVQRADKTFYREDMEVDFDAMTMHFEFSKFVVRKSKGSLEKMWTWVTARGKGKFKADKNFT